VAPIFSRKVEDIRADRTKKCPEYCYIKVLKNYANFDGRARRAEYWYFFLFNMIIAFPLAIVGGLIGNTILSTLYSCAIFLPSLAVGVRRMHDVGKSGWYLLIPIYSFILAVTEGDSGPNNYGPDPKDESQNDPHKNPFE
jgi:uncharacterized membrane protein YhaH (DUF805 family)